MPVIRIDGFDDPRLADYRNVSDGELLRRGNCFVAEGRLIVSRLVASGHRIDSILVNDASLRALEPALSGLATHVPVYVSGTAELSALTGFHLHRGCLALAERPPDRVLADVVRNTGRLLVLEGVSDADNVGSAFRNAAAFGASVLLNSTCCDPLYRKAIRTSMGSVLTTPYARAEAWPDDLRALKAEGFEVIALSPRSGTVDLHALAPRARRIALLVGSEGPGLSEEAEAVADMRVRIPISADVDSLNLATAAGIALYYFTRSSSSTPNP